MVIGSSMNTRAIAFVLIGSCWFLFNFHEANSTKEACEDSNSCAEFELCCMDKCNKTVKSSGCVDCYGKIKSTCKCANNSRVRKMAPSTSNATTSNGTTKAATTNVTLAPNATLGDNSTSSAKNGSLLANSTAHEVRRQMNVLFERVLLRCDELEKVLNKNKTDAKDKKGSDDDDDDDDEDDDKKGGSTKGAKKKVWAGRKRKGKG